jgi:hypothetical protein
LNIVTTTTGKVNMNIDENGSMVLSGFSTNYNPGLPSDSDVTINGNIHITGPGGSEQQTGRLIASNIVLSDRDTAAYSYMWVGNNNLLWQSPIANPVDVLGWVPLLAPTDPSLNRLTPGVSTLNDVINTVNTMIDMFKNRNLFFQVPYQGRPIRFQSDTFVVFGTFPNQQTFSTLPYYSDISGLTSALSISPFLLSIVFDTTFFKIYLNTSIAPITIHDGDRVGSAQRFLNHIGLPGVIVPSYGSITIRNSEYGNQIPESGLGNLAVIPLSSAMDPSSMSCVAGSRSALLSWTTVWSNQNNPGYDTLMNYGIYNGVFRDIVSSKGQSTIPNQSYRIYGLLPNTMYTYSITAIGMYDESGSMGFQFTTTSDIPNIQGPTGILMTQYFPNVNIPDVDPTNATTFGSIVGSVDVSSQSLILLPMNSSTTESYLYSTAFSIVCPDDYPNVYIGVYAADGGSVDAYRLTIQGPGVDVVYGIWEQQATQPPGVAQYFGPITFVGGIRYSATLVTMNATPMYSFGMFFIQVQTVEQPGITTPPYIDPYRRYSPTLDQYPRTPLLTFCSRI